MKLGMGADDKGQADMCIVGSTDHRFHAAAQSMFTWHGELNQSIMVHVCVVERDGLPARQRAFRQICLQGYHLVEHATICLHVSWTDLI